MRWHIINIVTEILELELNEAVNSYTATNKHKQKNHCL